jgi:HSP20 family molecular chaperone IbpA
MPRLFDWLEGEFPMFPSFPGFRWMERERAIRCEEYIEDGKYVLRAELPGIDPDKDVDVSVANGVLTVTAERREERKESHHSEFYYGTLHRSLTLPAGVDEGSVTATYRDGVLQVVVPFPAAEETPARKVPIERQR